MSMLIHKGMKMSETVDTPVQGILTQEQFDALPAEQQAKGFYIIDDGGEEGSPGGIYSTEEIRVGTWIDGKPLYRKVGKSITPSSSVWSTVLQIDNVETAVSIFGTVFDSNGALFQIPNQAIHCALQKQNLFSVFPSTSQFTNKECTLIVEYTKTTDTVTKAVSEPLARMNYDIAETSASLRNGEEKAV